jgi:hypothetical protein
MPGPTIQDVLDKLEELAQNQLYVRQEYNLIGDEDYTFLGNTLIGQTFTPVRNYQVTRVRFKFRKYGSPGNVTMNIYATDGNGLPTGDSLCSVVIDGNLITEDSAGEWCEFICSTVVSVTKGVMYALTLEADSPGGVVASRDLSDPYTGGTALLSINGGTTWETTSWEDVVFEVYSGPNVNLMFQLAKETNSKLPIPHTG